MIYASLTRCVGTHGLASMSGLASVCRKTQPVADRRQGCSMSEALVLPRPPIDCIWSQNPEGLAIRDVALESQFARRLRPHQREGIIFLYECVMGFRSHRLSGRASCSLSAYDFDSPTGNPVYGCILADEMGLGKTVQAIALLWLLLKQGPYGGRPVIRRCLIVTPGSLMQSYLTRNGISAPPVIIMSYEMFLQNSHDVYNIPYLDMVICDEGHRLKNATVHTSMALRQIPARRRILLTGTPVQNDLNELWSLADFCAPGILGSSPRAFRDEWLVSSSENKYSATELSDCESECCQRPQKKLSRILEGFFLRRTAEVLRSDLMSKTESIIFCNPSVLQIQLEDILLRWVRQEFGIDELDGRSLDEKNCDQQQYESTAQNKTGVRSVLCVITAFRKLYNHPELLRKFIETSSSTVDRASHGF
ncbi:hypothetical protein AHF37_00272 [Paragonimus kellicotti]|nr:hypothetical protein AHF37_00272 [Paragonimus kellicotti]